MDARELDAARANEAWAARERDRRARVAPMVGRRVRLVALRDEYTEIRAGEEGTVRFVDSLGTFHVEWDNGLRLGLVPGVDAWTLLATRGDER